MKILKIRSRKQLKKPEMNLGGLVGQMDGGTLTNSQSDVVFIIEDSYEEFLAGRLTHLNIGGAVGKARNATLDNLRSDSKIYIKDSKKFAELDRVLEESMNDPNRLRLAKLELEGIKSNIGKPGMAAKIERFLNLVNDIKELVEPFVPYLKSLI
jgi:hypothetical protein